MDRDELAKRIEFLTEGLKAAVTEDINEYMSDVIVSIAINVKKHE